jgi:hypothetical protein
VGDFLTLIGTCHNSHRDRWLKTIDVETLISQGELFSNRLVPRLLTSLWGEPFPSLAVSGGRHVPWLLVTSLQPLALWSHSLFFSGCGTPLLLSLNLMYPHGIVLGANEQFYLKIPNLNTLTRSYFEVGGDIHRPQELGPGYPWGGILQLTTLSWGQALCRHSPEAEPFSGCPAVEKMRAPAAGGWAVSPVCTETVLTQRLRDA